MHDLIIIGGGPAGTSAAVYAARKRLKTIFLTSEWGGQSAVSSEIQNWIGTPAIMGADLADNLKKHVEAYKGDVLQIVSPSQAISLKTFDDHVEVMTKKGDVYSALTALVTTGAQRRKLEVPGAAEFDNKGLTYCASCDGPLFAGQDVAVIGGGNAAFETALQLLAYCKSVTLLNRTEDFRADEITIAAAKSHANMRIITNATPSEVVGEKFVTGLKWKDAQGIESLLPVAGIFVEIGLLPNSGWLGDALELNAVKQIKVDPKTQRASHPRVWAAGDITDGLYHQNNIAAGDAVKALEDIYMSIRKNKSEA
ncbi:FAD-dependent oxidoreductase [Candidatus Kaiserbacteria bacterium]|nr:FAD-dependent oxidoreductase [Candidatus Kaiserbacteria bacterium]